MSAVLHYMAVCICVGVCVLVFTACISHTILAYCKWIAFLHIRIHKLIWCASAEWLMATHIAVPSHPWTQYTWISSLSSLSWLCCKTCIPTQGDIKRQWQVLFSTLVSWKRAWKTKMHDLYYIYNNMWTNCSIILLASPHDHYLKHMHPHHQCDRHLSTGPTHA